MSLSLNTLIFLQSNKEEELLSKLKNAPETTVSEKVSAWDNVLQLLGLCIILVIILIAAYYTTRFIGKYKMGQLKSSNFEIIEMFKVNSNNLLLLVRIADKFVVLGVSKDHVTYITEVDKDKILTFEVKEGDKLSFSQIIEKLKSKKE
jgi:Flagellar biosynthesis protein, FliO.